jgi:hypothetical protein
VATTTLFAEILVIGITALPWISLSLVAWLGTPTAQQIALMKGWEAVIGIIVLAFLYVVGVTVDRIADSLFEHLGQPILSRYSPAGRTGIPEAEMRLRVLSAPEKVVDFLNYARSRRRIARAAALNFTLTAAAVLFVGLWHLVSSGTVTPRLLTAIGVFSALMTVGSLYTWFKVGRTYYDRLITVHRIYIVEPVATAVAPAPATDDAAEAVVPPRVVN